MGCNKARIVNIQRYTIHDGPGIRTEVFFKGCPLHCMWCSNPESISSQIELGVYPTKCIGLDKCGLCKENCPLGDSSPLHFKDQLLQSVDRKRCPKDCNLCATNCYQNAIKVWGQDVSISELMNIILKDRKFYQNSGGGVTLNGGEVMLQHQFAKELLIACKNAGINTCIETSMQVSSDKLVELLPYCDLIIADIKSTDPDVCQKYIGGNPTVILDNIQKAVEAGKDLVLRVPVIPGINDSGAGMHAIAAFINQKLWGNIVQLQLLPYRRLGIEKYESLGITYPMYSEYPEYTIEAVESRVNELVKFFVKQGIPAFSGADNYLFA